MFCSLAYTFSWAGGLPGVAHQAQDRWSRTGLLWLDLAYIG